MREEAIPYMLSLYDKYRRQAGLTVLGITEMMLCSIAYKLGSTK